MKRIHLLFAGSEHRLLHFEARNDVPQSPENRAESNNKPLTKEEQRTLVDALDAKMRDIAVRAKQNPRIYPSSATLGFGEVEETNKRFSIMISYGVLQFKHFLGV